MENINVFDEKKYCCNCSACYNICPKQAIDIVEDEYGFTYPKINKEICIQCGLCRKICTFKSNDKYNKVEKIAYVSYSTDEDIRKNSASGGIFASIAKEILQLHGLVYGCSLENFDGKLIPKHIKIDKIDQLYKLQGSKYVQSDIGETFKFVKEDLEKEKLVLFSGTPCQVAGLKSFLRKDFNNLFTIDIICHGVPSAKFFQDYLNYMEKKINGKIINFKFRDKIKGWRLVASIRYKQGKKEKLKIIYPEESSYYKMFLDSKIYRDSCYRCPYANSNRPAELTIGDYWGIENVHPELLEELNIKKGVSCLVVNNQKGKEIIEKYCKNLKIYNSNYNNVTSGNDQLNSPSKHPNDRLQILNSYKEKGYKEIEKIYRKSRNLKYYIKKIYKLFPDKLKRILKK